MEQKTRRCPYCGEEILAVARKCKHCGEWLDKKEQKPCPVCGEQIDIEATSCPYCKEPIEPKSGGAYKPDSGESEFYYCKSCKSKLSKDAVNCPRCGDTDPFFFKKVKSINTSGSLLLWFIPIFILVGVPQWLNTFSLTTSIIAFVIIALLWIFFTVGLKIGSKSLAKENLEKMRQIFIDSDDAGLISTWKKDIAKRRGFAARLFGFYKIDS